MDDLGKNLEAEVKQFDRALRSLMRNLIRFSILFPDDIVDEMGSPVRQIDADSRSLSRFFSLEDQARKTLVSTSGNRLTAAKQIFEKSEAELEDTQRSLDEFKTRMDAIAPKIAKYLGIDDVATEFRAPLLKPRR